MTSESEIKELSKEEVNNQISAVLENVKGKLSPETVSFLEDGLKKVFFENMNVKDALHFPQKKLKEFYDFGYNLFNGGKYKDALLMFTILRTLDVSDPSYLWALAVVSHHMKNYEVAAAHYIQYSNYAPKDPMTYYHLRDCFEHLGQKDLAYGALIMARDLAQKDPRYKDLFSKLDLELDQFL